MRASLFLLLAACGRVGFDASSDDAFDFTVEDASALSFERSSIGTVVGPDRRLRVAGVDEPRFDHDPVTGEPWGLLVEGARQNLAVWSEALEVSDNWYSNGFTSVTPDVALAPDGTMTADEIDDQDQTVLSRRSTLIEVPDDTRFYAFSMFLHAGTSTRALFEAELLGGSDFVQTYVEVDLELGVITEEVGEIESSGVTRYADGWYRPWIVIRNNGTGTDHANLSVWGARRPIANVGSVYAWGAQLEVGEAPSSYIPTTAEEVSRSADIARVIDASTNGRGTLRTRARVASERPGIRPSACWIGSICIGRDEGARVATVGTVRATSAAWPLDQVVTTIAGWDAAGTRLDGMATTLAIPGASDELRLGGDGSAALDGHVLQVFYASEPP